EVGVLRRERVGADFRRGARQAAQQRRFAGVGQADQPRVGDHLQLQHQPALLAGGAGLRLARGTVGGRGERLVAAAAAAAARHVDLVAGGGQVAQHVAAVAVADDRPRRHRDDEVVGAAAVTVGAAAAAAALGAPELAVDNLGEAVGAGDGADDDRATVAAVAAVRPALGDVLLAAEAAHAGAAVAALDKHLDPINEHARCLTTAC